MVDVKCTLMSNIDKYRTNIIEILYFDELSESNFKILKSKYLKYNITADIWEFVYDFLETGGYEDSLISIDNKNIYLVKLLNFKYNISKKYYKYQYLQLATTKDFKHYQNNENNEEKKNFSLFSFTF